MMFTAEIIDQINQDKNLYYRDGFSVITVYDDNFFVRNDYDILSRGQRNYLVQFFKNYGYQQSSGKLITNGHNHIHLPKPKHTLALSAYQTVFNQASNTDIFAVTPSTFAEVIFYQALENGIDWGLRELEQLIETCPYNIELIRDINYRTAIETLTKQHYQYLQDYQLKVVEQKFKFKKTL